MTQTSNTFHFHVNSGFHRLVNEISLFWDVTRHRQVVTCRRFGKTHRPHQAFQDLLLNHLIFE